MTTTIDYQAKIDGDERTGVDVCKCGITVNDAGGGMATFDFNEWDALVAHVERARRWMREAESEPDQSHPDNMRRAGE